jgi:hypothetical protein
MRGRFDVEALAEDWPDVLGRSSSKEGGGDGLGRDLPPGLDRT